MKTSVILFLSLAFVSGKNEELPKTNVSVATQIVNGRDAREAERPFQVSLQLESGWHFCGGSVVNKNWVVSAAHCTINKNASDIRVLAGTIDRRNKDSRLQAIKIINHEKYNLSDFLVNDISVIKVDKPFQFSNLIQPAKLPQAGFKTTGGQIGTVSGWGLTTLAAGVGPYILQIVDVTIIDLEECIKALDRQLYPVHLCANSRYQPKGFCPGDSGGPLTVDGTLVGIVSFFFPDPDCASQMIPEVYARVSQFVDWINRNIQN